MQAVPAPVSFHSVPIARKQANDRALVIYGFILVFILQSFVGASLAEFVSAYPTEGGMYHWIAAIAPKRYNSLLSFATGWCTVFGCGLP
jgi:choline transport protein